MNVKTLGKQITALRREKGVTQEELAKYIGVSAQAVSKWENGGATNKNCRLFCSADRCPIRA